MNQEYDAAVEQHRLSLAALREEMKAKSKQFFAEGSKLLFERFPELESFGWRQFTPYFNDGDTCYFRVRAYPESVYINGEGSEDWASEQIKAGKNEDEVWNLPETVAGFVEGFDTDSMQEIFGDHVKVTVYRDADPEVTDYVDHD